MVLQMLDSVTKPSSPLINVKADERRTRTEFILAMNVSQFFFSSGLRKARSGILHEEPMVPSLGADVFYYG